MHGIFLSQSLLTSQSLRATIGPLQFSLRHWNLRNLTLHSGMLPYKHASRSLDIFSANTVLSLGSIMLPPHQPRVFARLARWQSYTTLAVEDGPHFTMFRREMCKGHSRFAPCWGIELGCLARQVSVITTTLGNAAQ